MNTRLFARAGCVLWLILALASTAAAQQGTVHLHSGGRIHGELMEVLPGDRVSIRLADGTVRSVPWSEVARVEEPSAAPAPPPAPAPYVPPPPSPEVAPPPQAARQYGDPPPPSGLRMAAQRSRQLSLAISGVLGLGGSISAEADGLTVESNVEVDFEPSFGGSVHFDAPLLGYFSLGAFARVLSFAFDGGEERGLFMDFAFAPRARFPFPLGSGWGAAYLQVALGLGTVDMPGTSTRDTIEDSLAIQGLIGTGAGVQLMFSSAIGAVFEVGWQHRFWEQTYVAASAFADTQEVSMSFTGGQVMLQAGLLIGF